MTSCHMAHRAHTPASVHPMQRPARSCPCITARRRRLTSAAAAAEPGPRADANTAQLQTPALACTARRSILLAFSAVAYQGTLRCQPAAAETSLPKAYQELVRKLSKALRESIEAEQAGEKENEVRRKADPAKEALQTFVKRWRDDPKVAGHPSHTQVVAVLSELGAFYQANGPRARMPKDVQDRLLGYLSTAELSLTQERPATRQATGAPALSGGADSEDAFMKGLLPTS